MTWKAARPLSSPGILLQALSRLSCAREKFSKVQSWAQESFVQKPANRGIHSVCSKRRPNSMHAVSPERHDSGSTILSVTFPQLQNLSKNLQRIKGRRLSTTPPQGWHRAYIALGSNVGDRLDMIEMACTALNHTEGIRLVRTSSLYETEPMYVENQDKFLNGACEVKYTAHEDPAESHADCR